MSPHHTEPVLILLPPSEKKSASPGPAIQVYTGVLYAALGWDRLTKAQQKQGAQSIVIISAKYGVVRPLDPIEPYKEKIVNKENFKMIDNCSHYPFIDQQTEFIGTIEKWLK